jgi:altronate dehydratase
MSPSSSGQARVVALDERDNVVNALQALVAGDRFVAHGREVVVSEPVPMGHKVAIVPIAAGEPVVKFGEPIAIARVGIAVGCHVHVHNVDTLFQDWLAARQAGAGA